MSTRKKILFGLGGVVTLLGLLFVGQGTGMIPFSGGGSMVGSSAWVTRGSVIAAIGLLMILIGRRIR